MSKAIAAIWLALTLAACGTVEVKGGSTQVDQPKSIYVQDRTILVLPVSSLRKSFKSYTSVVHTELVDELHALGYDCFVITEEQYQQLRQSALEAAGYIYNPKVGDSVPLNEAQYMDSLIGSLQSVGQFDLLVFPSLVLKKVAVQEGRMQWDGLDEPLVIRGGPRPGIPLPKEARGLSLQLAVYRPDLSHSANYFGALAVPYYLDISQQPPRFMPRKAVLNTNRPKAAVRVAIQPFVKQP